MFENGHLDIDRSKLLGQEFCFYAYKDKNGQLDSIDTSVDKEFMVQMASLSGYKKTDVVKGVLKIVGFTVDGAKQWEDKENIYFGCYYELERKYEDGKFRYKQKEPEITMVFKDLIGCDLCFGDADVTNHDKVGQLIAVIVEVLSYEK